MDISNDERTNSFSDRIKFVASTNLGERFGMEKLLFQINEILGSQITNFRNQSDKKIPPVRMFDSPNIPDDTVFIINDNKIVYEKHVSDEDLNDFGNLIYKQMEIVFNENY